MDSQIASCPWEAIEDFRSLGEFERFEAWMLNQVAQGQAVELLGPVHSSRFVFTSWNLDVEHGSENVERYTMVSDC